MSEKVGKRFEAPHEQGSRKTFEVKSESANLVQAERNQAEKLTVARQEVESQTTETAKTIEKLQSHQETAEEDMSYRPPNRELKKVTFQKEIKHIRRKLTKIDVIGSQIVHQPLVQRFSEVSSKTITRPSGLLGGGFTAFLGTGVYLYLTKDIGLKYNYSIFLFLLIAGFVLGILIEALVRLFRKRKAT